MRNVGNYARGAVGAYGGLAVVSLVSGVAHAASAEACALIGAHRAIVDAIGDRADLGSVTGDAGDAADHGLVDPVHETERHDVISDRGERNVRS
jgi:hypothetical protein